MRRALPEHLWPLPKRWDHCRELGQAIDSKIKLGDRRAPGALMRLCNADEIERATRGRGELLNAARSAFGRRFVETPGVVGAYDVADNLPPIVLEARPLDVPGVEPYWGDLRNLWVTPGGIEFSSPADRWRHAREMSCGFYYYWDPQPPTNWLEARREWKALARETLKYSRTYDTEMGVARACNQGRLGVEAFGVYSRWAKIRPSFTPNTVAKWLDLSVLEHCATWAEKNSGIVWVEHREFGERLSNLAGLPFFSNGGIDKKSKEYIEDCSTKTCIASIDSNKEGRNLQRKWSKNLVVSCPPGGAVWEQMLGRTHRQGQEADEVTVEVLISCREQLEGFNQALADCEFQTNMQQQRQKLMIADRLISDVEAIATKATGPWA